LYNYMLFSAYFMVSIVGMYLLLPLFETGSRFMRNAQADERKNCPRKSFMESMVGGVTGALVNQATKQLPH